MEASRNSEKKGKCFGTAAPGKSAALRGRGLCSTPGSGHHQPQYGKVGMVVFGQRMDFMILDISSNLSDNDSGSFPGKRRLGLALLTKPALDDALESISSKLTRKWLSSTTSEQILAALLQLLLQYSGRKREKLPFRRSCEGLGAVSHL